MKHQHTPTYYRTRTCVRFLFALLVYLTGAELIACVELIGR